MPKSNDPWVGEQMISFKASDELVNMVRVAAAHEHRNMSELIRRALMLYLEQGGFFEKHLDSGETLVRKLVDRAKEELDARNA